MHVAAYVEALQGRLTVPSIKLQLTALRMLFDLLVTHQVLAVNPASSIHNPSSDVRKRNAPMLTAEDARTLLNSLDISLHTGLRDRALIGLIIYNLARVEAALKMRIGDVDTQGRRTWIRLHQKGGKCCDLPLPHNLDEYLHAYMEDTDLGVDEKGFLFRAAQGDTGKLSDRPMSQLDVWRMIERRARAADIHGEISNCSF
jgi:site-specific recombinase XerD